MASATANVKVGAGTGATAGSQTSSTGGNKIKQVSKAGGAGAGTATGKVGEKGTSPGPNLPVVEPKQGQNVQVLAKTFVTNTGAASKG